MSGQRAQCGAERPKHGAPGFRTPGVDQGEPMGQRHAGICSRSNLSIRETVWRTSETTSVAVAGCAIRTRVTLVPDATRSGRTDLNTARNASYPQLVQ